MKSIPVKIVFLSISVLRLANAFGQTPQQIENSLAFSKLYGYVKYFHPRDEAAAIDWNRFAIYGSQQVSQSKNTEELQKVLTDLFKHIAPTLQLFPTGEKIIFNKEAVMVANAADYKTIAWQHSGVGLGGRASIYKSARTNRSLVNADQGPQFAPATSWLNAVPLQGKEFIFRGKMRMLNGEGQAQLWVRVDRTNKTMGFFDNMDDRPVKKIEWASYEIKGKVDPDAAFLYFGVMLVGKGEIEFDDLSLQVKEDNEWKELYSASFSEDEKGKAPKGLNFNTALTTYAIAVRKDSTIQQSYVSIRSKDPEPENKRHTSLFKQHPEVGEYLEKTIGGGLKVMLPLALYGTNTQTFPVTDTSALQQLNESLKSLTSTDMTGDNLYARLGNLAIAWNVFQHFYPYFDVVKTDWNNTLKEAIKRAYTDQTSMDFHKTLQQLTAQLKDGHVRVGFSGNKNLYMPLLNWEWVQGDLVVTHVGDTSLTLKRGDIVKQIDNHSAKNYFATIYPNISAATKGWLEYRAQTESLMGEKGSVMKLNILRNDNAIAEVAVTRNANASQYYAALPKEDSIKALKNGIMYVNIGTASMEAINKTLPELQKSHVIICDLRGYPNNNHDFIKYLLTQKDTSRQWMQVPQIIYPDRERIAGWQNFGWELQPAKTHLDAKIIFLIDGQAISYAESFMSFIENYKLATIIGQPTAGTNGNVNSFALPGGYSISWTGMRVQKHDGTTHHGVGIQPNIYVQKTIKGVQEGRDEFLEKAVEVAGGPF